MGRIDEADSGSASPGRGRGIFGAALLVLVLLLPTLAAAQDTRSTVRLDGRSLFRVSTTDDLAAADRAARVEARLTSLLQTGNEPPSGKSGAVHIRLHRRSVPFRTTWPDAARIAPP